MCYSMSMTAISTFALPSLNSPCASLTIVALSFLLSSPALFGSVFSPTKYGATSLRNKSALSSVKNFFVSVIDFNLSCLNCSLASSNCSPYSQICGTITNSPSILGCNCSLANCALIVSTHSFGVAFPISQPQ